MNAPQNDHTTVMKLSATGVSNARTDVDARGITIIIDEPPQRGGDNAGATPPETLLAALAGCTNRISHKIAEAKGIDIRDMTIGIEAPFDRRGVNLEAEVGVPFESIHLAIEVTSGASEADIEALKTDLRKFCPISKILRQAGTEIKETWTIKRP